MFKLVFDVSGQVIFDGISNELDPNLHLFNSAGNPLAANDDSVFSLNSQIIFNITAGTYFLAIGDNNIEATDGQGTRISDNDAGVLVPNGVLGGWEGSGSGSGGSIGNYTLRFSVATAAPGTSVPEPASIAGLSVLGLGFLLKKKQLSQKA